MYKIYFFTFSIYTWWRNLVWKCFYTRDIILLVCKAQLVIDDWLVVYITLHRMNVISSKSEPCQLLPKANDPTPVVSLLVVAAVTLHQFFTSNLWIWTFLYCYSMHLNFSRRLFCFFKLGNMTLGSPIFGCSRSMIFLISFYSFRIVIVFFVLYSSLFLLLEYLQIYFPPIHFWIYDNIAKHCFCWFWPVKIFSSIEIYVLLFKLCSWYLTFHRRLECHWI